MDFPLSISGEGDKGGGEGKALGGLTT